MKTKYFAIATGGFIGLWIAYEYYKIAKPEMEKCKAIIAEGEAQVSAIGAAGEIVKAKMETGYYHRDGRTVMDAMRDIDFYTIAEREK